MTAVVTAETHAEFAPPTAPARLAEIKVKGAAAIAVRLTRISVLNARTAAVKGDCGDITALQAQLSADTAGLSALNTTLAAETDITKARAEYRQIYIGFLIFALQSRKTNVVVHCGSSAARIPNPTRRKTRHGRPDFATSFATTSSRRKIRHRRLNFATS